MLQNSNNSNVNSYKNNINLCTNNKYKQNRWIYNWSLCYSTRQYLCKLVTCLINNKTNKN